MADRRPYPNLHAIPWARLSRRARLHGSPLTGEPSPKVTEGVESLPLGEGAPVRTLGRMRVVFGCAPWVRPARRGTKRASPRFKPGGGPLLLRDGGARLAPESGLGMRNVGDDAPAAPSDLTVVPGTNGARSASLSWTLPETTFGGEVLTNGLTGIVIERNGEVIATLPGYATEYDDESVTEDGEYEYVVYATNALGNGGKARVFSFIGNDMPDKVGNIRFTVGDACASAILSWTAPTKGFNGGYFSEDGLTYRIVRMPDNKTVAEGLTETTFTDTSIGRLGRYTYVIYACNAYGETAADASEAYVLGDALDLPVTQDFSNLSYFENQWMAYDGNDDKYSWNYSSEWGYYQFGDATPCAEYIINPGIDNPGNDADEWLVTPPLAFDAKKQYCMKLTVRCTTDETLKLTVGNNNVMTGHEEFGEIILKPVVDDDKYGISEYEVNLPAGIDGVKCIGLHLASPYPAEGFSYLQIMNVTIDEGQATGMSSAVTDNAGRTDDNNVYTLDGRLVRTDGSLDGLAKGVYVKGGRKYVVK